MKLLYSCLLFLTTLSSLTMTANADNKELCSKLAISKQNQQKYGLEFQKIISPSVRKEFSKKDLINYILYNASMQHQNALWQSELIYKILVKAEGESIDKSLIDIKEIRKHVDPYGWEEDYALKKLNSGGFDSPMQALKWLGSVSDYDREFDYEKYTEFKSITDSFCRVYG